MKSVVENLSLLDPEEIQYLMELQLSKMRKEIAEQVSEVKQIMTSQIVAIKKINKDNLGKVHGIHKGHQDSTRMGVREEMRAALGEIRKEIQAELRAALGGIRK